MTSEKHFFKHLKENMTHKFWLFALSLFLYTGFGIACAFKAIAFNSMDISYGPGNRTLLWLTVIIAILCAFQSFSHLFQKRAADFYFGLPLKRKTLFVVNYINSIIVFLIPFLLYFLICTIAQSVLSNTNMNQIVSYGGWEVIITIIGFLLVYHVTLLIIFITGSFLTAVPVLFISFFYSQILVQNILVPYCEKFYKTFYKSELLNILKEYLSPIFLYGKMAGIDTGLDIEQDLFILATKAFVAACICVVLSLVIIYILYQKRPAEACQKAFVYKYTGRIIQWLIVIPGGLFSGLLLSEFGSTAYLLPLCILGIILASVFFHEVFEILFEFRFQKFFQRKLRLCLQILCGIGIVSFLFLFRNSYNTYLPYEKNIENIGISIAGLDVDPDYLQWFEENDLTEERLENCVITTEHKKSAYDWIQTQIYSDQEQNNFTTDTIAFHLKDGKTIYRKYSISCEMLEQFDPIYQTADYKSGLYDIMLLSTPRDREFYWSNGIETLKLSLSEEERIELLSLFQSELKQLSITDIKSELPISSLTLKNDRSKNTAFIYPSFTKTIAFLEQRNIPVTKAISDYDISSVTIKKYKDQGKNYYGESKQTLIDQKTTEDTDMINTIKSSFIYNRYANQPLLYPINTSSKITAEIQSEGIMSSVEVSCYASEDLTSRLK